MNYIAHHEVARQFKPGASADFLFGSMLSDLARMANQRHLSSEIINPDLLAGNTFHRQTNIIFDQQLPVVELEASLKDAFKFFLPWRVAIQASRAGKDLLFDGTISGQSAVIKALGATLDCLLLGRIELAGAGNVSPLIETVRYIRTNGPPHYEEVDVVTGALFNTLSRTRTPIENRHKDEVYQVLEAHQGKVFEIGSAVLRQTISDLERI